MTVNINSNSLLFEALEVMKQIYGAKLNTWDRNKAIYYDKENKCIVATDNKRLLTYTLSEAQQDLFNSFDTPFFTYEKGYLTGVNVNDKPALKSFPINYSRVIPDNEKTDIVLSIDKHTIKKGGKGCNWVNYGYAMRFGLFNYELFEKINIVFDKVRHFKDGYFHCCKFTNEYFTFVVVGLKEETQNEN